MRNVEQFDDWSFNPNVQRPQDTVPSAGSTALRQVVYLREVPYTGNERRTPAPVFDRSNMTEFDNRPA